MVTQIIVIAGIRAQNIAFNTTGSAANAAAILDLTNTANLGFLIPAITTATLPTTVATGSQGLLFYNTTSSLFNVNTSTGTTPTFAPISNVAITNGLAITTVNSVNSITSTVNTIASSYNLTSAIAAAAWVLSSGNTVTTGNFIGTTNAQDLVLVTNNLERTRILNGSGYVGIGTAAPASTLDVSGTFGSKSVILTSTSYTIGATGATIYYIPSTTSLTYIILPTVALCACNYRRYIIVNDGPSVSYFYSSYTSGATNPPSNYIDLNGSTANVLTYTIEIIADPISGNWLRIK